MVRSVALADPQITEASNPDPGSLINGTSGLNNCCVVELPRDHIARIGSVIGEEKSKVIVTIPVRLPLI
jgi:hypothetical protein